MVAAKGFAGEVSAPFCSGSTTCFTPTAWAASAFNFDKGSKAKDLATTIIGTKCVGKGFCARGVCIWCVLGVCAYRVG